MHFVQFATGMFLGCCSDNRVANIVVFSIVHINKTGTLFDLGKGVRYSAFSLGGCTRDPYFNISPAKIVFHVLFL